MHLIGQHLLGALVEEFEDMDDMEEELLDEEEGDEPHVCTDASSDHHMYTMLEIA